jgi:6-phosphogluconate dehydrogenase
MSSSNTMQLGLVGLGRMGAGIAARLLQRGHRIIGYDVSRESVAAFARGGGSGAHSLSDLISQLAAPRVVWLMVPHGAPTHDAVATLLPLLSRDDVLIDGGNSNYRESMAHAQQCAGHGVHFLDVGVSGGVWGEREGFNLMIGGARDAFARLDPAFASLAPPGGYAHVGGSGAGHFVKMIHNAIEYAMLQSIGEGFECMQRSDFNLDMQQIAALWQNGAVVRSWLLELLTRALAASGNDLAGIAPHIDDSGTGRWAVEYALEAGVPVPAISIALFERFDSRTEGRYAHQVIAALRNQFGGHAIHEAPQP